MRRGDGYIDIRGAVHDDRWRCHQRDDLWAHRRPRNRLLLSRGGQELLEFADARPAAIVLERNTLQLDGQDARKYQNIRHILKVLIVMNYVLYVLRSSHLLSCAVCPIGGLAQCALQAVHVRRPGCTGHLDPTGTFVDAVRYLIYLIYTRSSLLLREDGAHTPRVAFN